MSNRSSRMCLAILALGLAFDPFGAKADPPKAAPQAAEAPADANLVTALDVSDSIMRHEEWLQFDGLAKALRHPAFLQAVASGRHGRVGFAAFTWSSGGRFAVIVPWTRIASQGDAERVAGMLDRFSIDRSAWQRHDNGSGSPWSGTDRRTDVSATIDFAAGLARQSLLRAVRSVINICANGQDNVGAGPDPARDRALLAGFVINGLVIGGRPDVAEGFRAHVQGGPGSFVAQVTQPGAMVDAMLDKLLRDLIAARTAWPWT